DLVDGEARAARGRLRTDDPGTHVFDAGSGGDIRRRAIGAPHERRCVSRGPGAAVCRLPVDQHDRFAAVVMSGHNAPHDRYDTICRVTSPEYRFPTKWFTVRPLFAANHRWAMATGEISLAREIA